MPPTTAVLNGFLGQNIKAICGNHYAAPNDNHCAHFVSHAAGYGFGYTCKAQSNGRAPGASIRVHELFSHCPSVGNWSNKPGILLSGLVFVTAKEHVNLTKKEMSNVPKKHVGIFIGGTIWHYSNARHKVVTEVPATFVHHYPGPTIELFYGEFPR